MPENMKVDNGAYGQTTVQMNFPPNSHKKVEPKEEQRQAPKVEKVIKGTVVTRKRSWFKRVVETFVGEDVDNVAGYILHDVLVPAIKSTLSDMVQGGIEMLLFGERKGSRTKRDSGRSYVSYNNYSSSPSPRRDERREPSTKNRSRHSFDDIILSSRGEAEEVLSHLVDLTIDYREATVADLYDLVGISGDFTDRKYGWTDLRSASIIRARDGYQLNLPKAILLD